MHYKLLIDRYASNTDACKMFTALAHTILLSSLLLRVRYISTNYALTTLYCRPLFKVWNVVSLDHINVENNNDFLLVALRMKYFFTVSAISA